MRMRLNKSTQACRSNLAAPVNVYEPLAAEPRRTDTSSWATAPKLNSTTAILVDPKIKEEIDHPEKKQELSLFFSQQHNSSAFLSEEEEEIHGTETPKAAQTSLENGSSPESQKHKNSHGHKEANRAHRRVSKSHGTENGSEHSSHKNPKKASKVGSGSPSLERSYDSSTPGKARKKSTDQHDQTPDHASAVPKFDDWNETDPASGNRYTGIFDKVREEKKTAKKPPMITTDPEFFPDYGVQNTKDHGCSCFGWFRK